MAGTQDSAYLYEDRWVAVVVHQVRIDLDLIKIDLSKKLVDP